MFVFGDAARRSRRPGPHAVMTLVAVASAAAITIAWPPEFRPAPTPASSQAPPFSPSCTPGTLRPTPLAEGLIDLRALRDAILDHDAKKCEYLTAHDPQRNRFSATPTARSETETINAAVEAAICPGPLSCLEPRYGSTTDVAKIRDALLQMGYPEAKVRQAEYVGESPEDDIVHGLRLWSAAGCLVSFARIGQVSFARIGQGVAPMGPVGTLRTGRCLHAVN